MLWRKIKQDQGRGRSHVRQQSRKVLWGHSICYTLNVGVLPDSICWNLMLSVLTDSICWNLMLSVMVLGAGAFGKWWKSKWGSTELPCPFCHVKYRDNQKAGSCQTPNLLTPWSWSPQTRNTLQNKFLLFISHPIYGIFAIAAQID